MKKLTSLKKRLETKVKVLELKVRQAATEAASQGPRGKSAKARKGSKAGPGGYPGDGEMYDQL